MRVLIALAFAVVMTAVVAPAPGAADSVESHTKMSTTVPATDGVELAVDVYRPAGADPAARMPVAMVISPYLDDDLPVIESGRDLTFWVESPDFLAHGYTVVQASLRGFGRSGGCVDFGGPQDVADVKALVEWAADQPWSTGRVGVLGNSYEAWAGIMALAADPQGLAAVATYSPIVSAYSGLYMGGVHYGHQWHSTWPSYIVGDLVAGADSATPDEIFGRTVESAERADCYAEHLAFANMGDPSLPYWQERDLTSAAAQSDVPVFWTHGFIDANIKPDKILPLWSQLRGPKRAWFGQFLHGGHPDDKAPDGTPRFAGELLRWFDRHVAQQPADTDSDAPVFVQEQSGQWRAEEAWPPADAAAHVFPILDGQYVDSPGNWGQRDEETGVNVGPEGQAPVPTGVGSWTFTQPLPHQVHLSGVPAIDIKLVAPAPEATLVGLLYDVAPDGTAALISRGARTLPLGTTARLELYPQDTIVAEGHRLGLLLSGADDGWFTPGHTGRPVLVEDGSWSAPFLTQLRTDFDDGVVLDHIPGLQAKPDQRITIPAPVISARTADAPPPPPQQHPPKE